MINEQGVWTPRTDNPVFIELVQRTISELEAKYEVDSSIHVLTEEEAVEISIELLETMQLIRYWKQVLIDNGIV